MALLLTEHSEIELTLGRGGDVEVPVAEDGLRAFEPTLGGLGTELGAIGVIARPDVGHGAIGELEAELHGLLDLLEEVGLGLRQFLGHDGHRIGIGRHAAGLDGIDAHVEQRAAAGELLLDAPGVLTEREAVGAGHLHERTKLLGLGQTDEFLVIRIEVQAVADCEALTRLLTRRDHGVAVGDRGRHRLLADDVLAGAEGIDDVLRVDAGGRDDVDDVDVLIGGDLVPLVVGIDIGYVEAMELRQLLPLRAGARDRGHQLHMLGLQQCRRELAIGIAA